MTLLGLATAKPVAVLPTSLSYLATGFADLSLDSLGFCGELLEGCFASSPMEEGVWVAKSFDLGDLGVVLELPLAVVLDLVADAVLDLF